MSAESVMPAPPGRWKRATRRLLLALGLLAAVPVAWTLSNLVDSGPAPRPDALALKPPVLPDERNAFFALVGLRAPGSADPRVHGRQQWLQDVPAAETAGIAVPMGTPFECGSDGGDCAAQWLEQAEPLKAQLARYAELGERCAALARGMEFEELLPPEGDARWLAAQPAPHAANAALCSRWLLAQGVVAAARGDVQAAADGFAGADRFDRALLEGSRSLVGNAVGWAALRRTWQTASTVAAARPGMAAALQPLAAPLPLSVREASHWVPGEAAFQRAMIDHLRSGCEQQGAAAGMLSRLWCRTGLGTLPNVSKADIDAYWLQVLAATRDGLAPALQQPPLAAHAPWWRQLAWRNTFGRVLLRMAAGTQAGYVARQADLLLHHQAFALALAMARERVPPQGRAAWLAARPLDPALRARLRLEGDQLVADDWSAVHGAQQSRYRIRIPLPHP